MLWSLSVLLCPSTNQKIKLTRLVFKFRELPCTSEALLPPSGAPLLQAKAHQAGAEALESLHARPTRSCGPIQTWSLANKHGAYQAGVEAQEASTHVRRALGPRPQILRLT